MRCHNCNKVGYFARDCPFRAHPKVAEVEPEDADQDEHEEEETESQEDNSEKRVTLREVSSSGSQVFTLAPLDSASLLGGESFLIPIRLSYNGISVVLKALVDTGANRYLFINNRLADRFRASTGAPQGKLETPRYLTSYKEGSAREKVDSQTTAHLWVQGARWLNEPFIEVRLGDTDVILGRKWLKERSALPDCEDQVLLWKRPPPMALPSKDITIRLSAHELDPRRQSEMIRRDGKIAAAEKRASDGCQKERVGLGLMDVLVAPMKPKRTIGSTFSYDKKASLKKMALALEGLEYLVRPPPRQERSPDKYDPDFRRAESGSRTQPIGGIDPRDPGLCQTCQADAS